MSVGRLSCSHIIQKYNLCHNYATLSVQSIRTIEKMTGKSCAAHAPPPLDTELQKLHLETVKNTSV